MIAAISKILFAFSSNSKFGCIKLLGFCGLITFMFSLIAFPMIAVPMYIYVLVTYSAWGTRIGTWMLVYIISCVLWLPLVNKNDWKKIAEEKKRNTEETENNSINELLVSENSEKSAYER